MIVRVVQQAAQSSANSVVVAVDDKSVQKVVEEAGYTAVLTAPDHASGSDRVMEVANLAGWSADDIVINVQGDEPLLPPVIIDHLANAMQESASLEMATLSEPIKRTEDFIDPNVVKVVSDTAGFALYFSRAPVPYPRDEHLENLDELWFARERICRHVGVYAFRVAALAEFVCLCDSRLERLERLEQLRWLEAGRKLKVLPSPLAIPGGVDTPDDLARVERLFAADKKG